MPDQSDAPQSVAASAEQLPPAIRELHRAVLRGFRDSGQVHRDDLRPTAAALGVDLDDALHQLGSADLVHSAPDGQIEVAYPFSRQPTGHTVHLTGHPPVAAMCAIDALGIPLMTGTDGVIDSADPTPGHRSASTATATNGHGNPPPPSSSSHKPTAPEPWPITSADRSPSTLTGNTRIRTSTTIPNCTATSSARPTRSPWPTAPSEACLPADRLTNTCPNTCQGANTLSLCPRTAVSK